MVEPTRKRNKATRPIPVYAAQELSTRLLIINSTHPDSPGTLDLNEFHTGKKNSSRAADNVGARVPFAGSWKGGFTGRPALIEELAPHIRAIYGTSPDLTLSSVKGALRAWWRLLDKYEDLAPVSSVRDFDDMHGALQLRDGISGENATIFLRIVNAARDSQNISCLYWQKNERPQSNSDVPEFQSISRIYHELKRRVFNIFHRWEDADVLANSGVNWTNRLDHRAQNQPWTIEDIHSTYRGFAMHMEHPCPSQSVLTEHMSYSPSREAHFFEAVFGRYPSRRDVQNIFMLFLLRTGWNGGPAINMNAEEESAYLRPHPISPDHHIVYTIKKRGNTEQVAIGLNKSALSPGNLIKALWVRTEPLRLELRRELKILLTCAPTREVEARIAELRRRIRSPWLYVSSRNHNEIDALDIRTYSVDADRVSIIRNLIRHVNSSLPSGDALDERMTLGDFRDAYISYAYQASGYSWLVAQLAAGHSSLESLKAYLRKRRWKAHGEKKVRTFQTVFWTEIESRRIVDASVLFALVERGEITEEQRMRWLQYKDRTRVGMGCKSFQNPPPEIAPHHVSGDGCRVQRCTLCHHGIVFEDSVGHMARRLAELYWLKARLPLTTWHESSFEDELEATETTLRLLFDATVVEKFVQFWTIEIEAGRHKPLQMEGEYGA